MKKRCIAILTVAVVLLSCMVSIPLPIHATEVTENGTLMTDSLEKKVYGVILRRLSNSNVTRLIIGKQVSMLYYDDYYETDPSMYQYYNSIVAGCPNLEEFAVTEGSQYLKAEDGMLLSKDGKEMHACPVKKGGNIVVPEGVTVIRKGAFNSCKSLESISLPSTLSYVCEAGLGNNKACKEYKINENNKYFTVINGVLYSKDLSTLVSYPAGKEEEFFEVPAGVKYIDNAAFMGNAYLKKIQLPDTVEKLGVESFEDCSALEVFIGGKRLRRINAGAFYNCKSLSQVTLQEGLLVLEEDSFKGTVALKSITIPMSVVSISNVGFSKNTVMTVYRNSMAAITFENNSLKVKYLKAKDAITKKLVKNTKASKGKGKPNTNWYKKGKKKYTLKSPDDLAGLAKLVNKGNTFEGCTITLTKDIDLIKYKEWTQIGGVHKVKGKSKKCVFKGTFDAKKHTIYNLVITKKDTYTGLFYRLDTKGTIKNVRIKGAYVNGGTFTGALVGGSYGKIDNCKVYGSVQGMMCVGGIVGITSGGGTINNCSAHAVVKGVKYVGGIVGEAWNNITNCRNHDNVSGSQNVGGIAGKLVGKIKQCTNEGTITAIECAGGIVSDDMLSTLSGCKNTGKVIDASAEQ